MTRTAYTYDFEPDQCDIPAARRPQLLQFRERLHEWRVWFFTDDHHAISDQIYSMMWRDAVFRMINETRLAQPGASFSTSNGLIAEALDEGFLANQAISLRRLIDKASDVISIPRIINDIEKHRALITREMFVCHDGLPYDWEAVRDAELEVVRAAPSGGPYWRMASTGSKAWDMSGRVHTAFDELSRVEPSKRTRQDVLHPAAIALIASALDNSGARSVADRANKYLLHAADARSRAKIPASSFDSTLNELSDVHRNLLQVAECIALKLLQSSLGDAIPTPQWNITENMDQPFVATTRLDDLHDFWRKHKIERDEWLQKPTDLHPR